MGGRGDGVADREGAMAARGPAPAATEPAPPSPTTSTSRSRPRAAVGQPGAGELLELVRTGRATTRGALQEVTGLSRATVGQRLGRLFRAGWVREGGGGPVDSPLGGRPAIQLEFDEAHAVVLAADLETRHARTALLTLGGEIVAERAGPLAVEDGPDAVLDELGARFGELLRETGHSAASVCGIGLAVPGPVDTGTGRVVQPPIMPGWDGYDIRGRLRRAIAEHTRPDTRMGDAPTTAHTPTGTHTGDAPTTTHAQPDTPTEAAPAAAQAQPDTPTEAAPTTAHTPAGTDPGDAPTTTHAQPGTHTGDAPAAAQAQPDTPTEAAPTTAHTPAGTDPGDAPTTTHAQPGTHTGDAPAAAQAQPDTPTEAAPTTAHTPAGTDPGDAPTTTHAQPGTHTGDAPAAAQAQPDTPTGDAPATAHTPTGTHTGAAPTTTHAQPDTPTEAAPAAAQALPSTRTGDPPAVHAQPGTPRGDAPADLPIPADLPGLPALAELPDLPVLADLPVLVDNDANLMAYAEQHAHYPDCAAFALVKVSTGIGAGVVVDGAVYRGIDGGAGDIGHIRVPEGADALCKCGSYGCLAAVASGRAVARRLTEAGIPAASGSDVRALLEAGNPEAVGFAREAGRHVGEVLATVVTLLNPGVLMIAGDLAGTPFLTGVRELLYQRALPRSTAHLDVVTSRLGERAALIGAGTLVVEHLYAPRRAEERLAALGL